MLHLFGGSPDSLAPGASDGTLDLRVNGQPQPSLSALDMDEARIGLVRWGAVAGIDPATTVHARRVRLPPGARRSARCAKA